MNETPPCKTDPRAPHGFDRNASHSADRYVCECEGWTPVDGVNISADRVDETDKFIHDKEKEWDAIEKELPAEAFGEPSPVWTKRF